MSDWYALERIEKSFEDMKQLLLPFNFKKMLKMALVVLFAGGGLGGMSNFSSTVSDIAGQSGSQSTGSITNNLMTGGITGMASAEAFLPGIILLAALLVIGWVVAGAIMKFVFVKICNTGEVSVWNRFKKNTGNGFRLLGFQLLVSIIGILIVGVPAGLLLLSGISNIAAGGIILLITIPVMIVMALINLITGDFVIVDMLDSDNGVLESWKALKKDLSAGWKQIGFYILIKIALMIGSGIVVGIASLVFLILAVIVFGIFGIIGYGLYSLVTALGAAYFFVMGVLAIAALVVGMLFIRVPVDTFFRYYSIRVFEKLVGRELVE